MRDLNEKSAEAELYHSAQSYSNMLDFESRSRKKPSFRINERSLIHMCCFAISFRVEKSSEFYNLKKKMESLN